MDVFINGEHIGKKYYGAGMVSGNNSSRLLLDYKYEHEEQYKEILEHIFGSSGICVNHLKLEMGADINSSSGTEPCVKRYENEPADVTRGAGYILAADAKKINPDLTLDMLFWSEPKWVTDSEDVYAFQGLSRKDGTLLTVRVTVTGKRAETDMLLLIQFTAAWPPVTLKQGITAWS